MTDNEVDTGSSERLKPMTIVDLYVWYAAAAVNGGAEAEGKAKEFARRLSAEQLKVAADMLAKKE